RVPTRVRSSSESTGQLTAPGRWSSAYSAGERASMTSSNSASCARVATPFGSRSDMDLMDKIKLTAFSHGGGCGCKIAPAVLSRLIAESPLRVVPKDLLVGTETGDDAAVYRLN